MAEAPIALRTVAPKRMLRRGDFNAPQRGRLSMPGGVIRRMPTDSRHA
jgi:hypothetical protein